MFLTISDLRLSKYYRFRLPPIWRDSTFQFVGKWFEIEWLPPQPIPEDQIFTDIKGHFELSSDETLLSVFLSIR